MAEIIRTTSVTTKSSTRPDQRDTVTSVEHVTVRSSTENRFSVSGLLDFAQALRDAAAPDRTQIECHRSHDTGHLNSLSAKFEIQHDQAEPTPAA